jgi:uncharacterized membrane protein YphA (DoxX/SURF4 family)
MNQHLELPFRALRFGLGLAAFLAGLDKFFNLLTQWDAYLSPLVTNLIPLAPQTFMRTVGVIEMAAGALLLAGATRLGGYVVAAWLVLIALSLVTTGHYFDVAVRDVEMAIAAFTLARMSEVRATAPVARRHAVPA